MTNRIRSGLLATLLLVPTATFASEGARLRPLAVIDADETGRGLRQPEAVAFDGKSLLAVADTGNRRLLTYTLVAGLATPAGEIRLGELSYPIRIQIDSKGELLALDGRSRRIVRVTRKGEFKGYVQPVGEGAAGPLVARSIAIDREDNLFVLDVSRARILVLGADGRIGRTIAWSRDQRFVSDLAVDRQGTVFAIDSVARRLYAARRTEAVLTPLAGGMTDKVSFPTAVAVDDQGRIFMADQNGGGIAILGTDGSFRGIQAGMGWRPGQLRYPSGICAGGPGTVIVADRDNNRVQVFAVSE